MNHDAGMLLEAVDEAAATTMLHIDATELSACLVLGIHHWSLAVPQNSLHVLHVAMQRSGTAVQNCLPNITLV